ncbi:MAG: PAS domain S-box protein, partial [Anaerolineae bacterium]
DLWSNEHAEFYHQKDSEILQHPERQVYEYVIRDKNNVDHNVIFVKGAFYDETGQIAGLVGAYVDITERKQAEEALRTSEEKYRSLIENSNDAIYILYGNQFEMINPRFEALFGITAEEVRAPDFDFTTLVAPQSRLLVAERQRKLKAGEALPLRYEFTALTRAGQEIEVEVSVSHIPYRDGLATQGILRDISGRKRMEQALRESEERFHELADLLPQVVSETDIHGNLVYANRMAFELFGYTPQDLEQGLNIFQMLAPEEHERAVHTFQEVITGSMAKSGHEYCARREDGSTFPVLIYTSPIVLQGQVTGLRALVVDITEHKQAEQAQQQLLERVQRQQTAVGALSLHSAFITGDVDAAARILTETVAEVLDVARVSLWLFDDEGTEIHCHTMYLRNQDAHHSGQALAVADFPAYFAALKEGRAIAAQDVRTDPHMKELVETYLSPNHITSMLDATLRLHGQVVGVICHEHIGEPRAWQPDEIVFTEQIADQMAQALANAERVQAQAALREREAYFRTLFEYAGDAIFIENNEDRILDVNHRACELLGYTREELLHMTIADIQAPERRGQLGSIIKEELTKYNGQPFETLDLHKDSTLVPVEVTAVSLATSEGNLALSIVRDISERVRAQQALQRERDLFSALADAAAAVSRTLDPDEVLDHLLEQVSRVIPNDATNIMLIEPDRQVRVARWRGYERFGIEEFIDSLVYDLDQVPNLVHMAESGEPVVIADTATYPGWVHAPEEAWLRAYVGAPIRIRDIVIGFLSADSATPGFFTTLHANILRAFANHAAVALENARLYNAIMQELTERERAESALRESEERYRRLFERSNDAIFLVDRFTGQYQEANEAAAKLTGRSMTELQELTALAVAPEGAEERLAQIQMANHNLEMGEVHYVRPDGASRTALLDIVPLNDQTVFSIARDITENKEIEERLRRQEQLAAVGQLAAGIAHDFRNLLTTIILYAQLGRRRPDLSPTAANYLETIVGEAHRATDLVKQILDFSRRTEIERRPLDIVGFVGNVVAVLQRTLPENIHIVLDIGSGPCIIEGDAGRLQQVLTNLALNAKDAMPDGGTLRIGVTRITVEPGTAPPLPAMVEALAPPAWICLSVTDTGIGMTEEAYAHLFEPFFTTKEEGQGTGLGLAQVYGIIQLHAGHIDVETAVGQGVTFRIYLPASTLGTEDDVEDTVSAPTGHGETLLLVEDNTRLREAGQNLLTALGYRVLTAANGLEALAIYQTEEHIALIVTDLVMPEMGGKALVQALHDNDPGQKVLVMTGYTTEESTESLRAA